jgi:hypothetical protein
VGKATDAINRAILGLDYRQAAELQDLQNELALRERFTYLLGPIRIALRPRLVTPRQLEDLSAYCAAMWADCLTLEKLWVEGELDEFIDIEEEELEIARMQPWQGGPAIFAADGLFGFGAEAIEP